MPRNLATCTCPSPAAQSLRPRGRPRGIGHCRQRTRFAIAERVFAGKPIATIARELKVSRSWASREAYAQETQSMLGLLLVHHRARIQHLLDTAFDTINQALEARKTIRVDGRLIDLGP